VFPEGPVGILFFQVEDMPRARKVDNQQPKGPMGILYVVATPIGNREDITLRALRIFREVDLIAAEDTRHTGRLLAHHAIQNKLVSYHEHNERERATQLVNQLKQGAAIALVTNAGTPSVSDPGYRLVNTAVANGIAVIPIPGVSAAITALSVAALPTDTFIFLGFPPRKNKQRSTLLADLVEEKRTLVFYDSPRRICAFLDEILRIMGDREVVLAREMTKLHEEYLRGPISKVTAELNGRPAVKGECTLLVKGSTAIEAISQEEIKAVLRQEMNAPDKGLAELSKSLAKRYGISKKMVYQEALNIKKANNDI
jgi:16S rRNA (cytidine1402-2'-O)-methyltransferase